MRKFALIGQNISYSLSPKIHRLIYRFFGIHDCVYEIIDIALSDLDQVFGRAEEYCGFNITIPYKKAVARFLTNTTSPIAPINTITIREGRITGFNTDIDGFFASYEKNVKAQQSQVKGFYPKSKQPKANSKEGDSVLIIGAGGAAEAAAYVLKKEGKSICIKTRSPSKAQPLIQQYSLETNYASFTPALIVNASGKNIEEECLLDDINTQQLTTILDMSYCFCGLSKHYKDQAIKYVDGLDMLIFQAIFAATHLYNIAPNDSLYELYTYIRQGLEEQNEI